jgi:paired amphipathic helix protein Sin3a
VLAAAQQGPNVVDLLRKNPTVAIPVVLARLEQKDKEWRQNRLDMIPQWRKVFEQNYNKSLDHRSFYFKQADKKSLTPKSMLQEIKDAADKRRADKAQLRTFSVGCPVSVYLNPPDLSFDYPDRWGRGGGRAKRGRLPGLATPGDSPHAALLPMQLVFACDTAVV